MNIFVSLISWLYYLMIFLVPLVLYPHSSEIFEFNKMISVYLFTTFVVFMWGARIIHEKKFIFRRTIMDIPILIFLGTLVITTLFSLDPHTSFYGYYTRFHGGLLSYFTYSLLYWGFVSNLNKEHSIKAMHALILSSVFVSIYGILQHFGIDKELWVQNVQGRIFSTLGQPNWLAAWIVSLIPLSLVYLHTRNSDKSLDKEKLILGNYWISAIILFIYYLVLSYTRSRSGFIAFCIAVFVYLSIILTHYFIKRNNALLLKKLALPIFLILAYSLVASTVFTPSLLKVASQLNTQDKVPNGTTVNTAQTIPSGSNDVPAVNFRSTDIRLIVWEGAIDVWKAHPVLGTGPETFAYSYYEYRPEEHNLVSEWDFLYNKAHNEYLNQLATTGLLGTSGYLIFHFAVMYLLFKNFQKDEKETKYIHLALFAGFISIIITNFAGFSVVPMGLLMFLYPAFSEMLAHKNQKHKEITDIQFDQVQKIYLIVISVTCLFITIRIFNYWRADHYYASAQILNDSNNYQESYKTIQKAIDLRSNENVYWQELSESEAGLALLLMEVDQHFAEDMANNAQQHTELAEQMNPHDVNTLRKQGSVYIKLSYIDPVHLNNAEQSVSRAVELAPTEAKLIYNLGVIRLRLGLFDQGISDLEKAIELRPIYADARYALALAYSEVDRDEDAKDQLRYILENINPNDNRASDELANLESGIDLDATPSAVAE